MLQADVIGGLFVLGFLHFGWCCASAGPCGDANRKERRTAPAPRTITHLDQRLAVGRHYRVGSDRHFRPGLVIREIWLLRLRTLLARARGDETSYRDYRDRYRALATSLGFEGHIKWAEAMP